MYADKAVRRNTAVEKSPHFALYEKWNVTVPLMLLRKKRFEIPGNYRVQRAVLGVARGVDAFGAYFSFTDHGRITDAARRFPVMRKIGMSISHKGSRNGLKMNRSLYI